MFDNKENFINKSSRIPSFFFVKYQKHDRKTFIFIAVFKVRNDHDMELSQSAQCM